MALVLAPALALALAAAKPTPVPKPSPASVLTKPVPRPSAAPAAPSPAPTPAPSAAPAKGQATPARLPATISGVVKDALSGQPLAGALVQQSGSVTSVFTGQDGRFRLLLERGGGATLQVSAMGFEDQMVAIGSGSELTVKLNEVAGFLPAAPLAPLVPVGQSNAETAPLNSGIIFQYALRNNAIDVPGASGQTAAINGWSNNDFHIGARFRWKPWLAELEGSHFETPVDLPGLRKEDNPAFKPSTWQAGARFGALWSVSPDVEVAALGAYRWSDTVPNNSRTPYTGSDIDFEQKRHALGAETLLAWRPGRGHWHWELGGGYYPLVYGFADAPGVPFAAGNFVDAHAILGYEVMPGLRVGLGGALERWGGTGEDQAVRLTIGMHYTPGLVPKGNE